jgi:hypothetical protein
MDFVDAFAAVDEDGSTSDDGSSAASDTLSGIYMLFAF